MPALAASLKEQIRAGREAAIDSFTVVGGADKLLKRLCQNVDAALLEAWRAFDFPSSTALVAVGGYGRGELYPYSDVDVLVLLDQQPDETLRIRLSELVTLFWDLGLEIGHSIRTVDECLSEAQADITVQTSLLEARLLTGDRKLFARLQERCAAAMDAQAFFRAKTLEMRQRHVKYEDTPYSLEPNVKESPGGLRDLQVILWVAKAAGLGDSWRGMAASGLITPNEARQLTQKERVFKEIRIRLHIHARRREDRLVFDVQTPVAIAAGYREKDGRRASEILMQHYYWAAKAVTQLNSILLQNMEVELFPRHGVRRPLSEYFTEVNGLVDIVHDEVFQEKP